MTLLKALILISIFFQFNSIAQTQSDIFNEDNCIDGQNLYAEDIDISNCPALPSSPSNAYLGDTSLSINLGAWELGQTSDGETYKYGHLSNDRRHLNFEGRSTLLNDKNLECWAKGYYRLRKILQNPPKAYIDLYKAKYQFRFFQFQTDFRNGSTGYTEISSYMDHLVKWVTVIDKDGRCIQPTLGRFETYLEKELKRRGF